MARTFEDKKARWINQTYDTARKRHPERRDPFETPSGIEVSPIYAPPAAPDGPAVGYPDRIGFPGEPPFTRGVYPTMYRGRPWTIRQYAGFGTARQTNRRFRYLLDRGQTGLSVAFDLPTQMGYDSDDAMSQGEVGRVGVAVDTIDDMRALFDGIPIDRVSTSMTINATAAVVLAMYVALADERGCDRGHLSGTIQNDILKEYIARGTYVFPPSPSIRLITNTFQWCAAEVPNFNPISISGYHIREAGATAVEELAFTLADGIAYIEAGLEAGLDVDTFAPRLSFFFSVHNDFLEEISKFRAARRIWARVMAERFGANQTRSQLLRFHTQTAGSALTAQQPENNVVRVAIQALAAVVGGTQSLHTNSYDEALGLPTDRTQAIALRTQQIILEETGVADTIDPLGGSYAVEALTDEIEDRARKLMTEIDGMGGMTKAIEDGFPQRAIERSAYAYQRAIERGERRVVGVNIHCDSDGDINGADVFRVDPDLESRQNAALVQRRGARDAIGVEHALDRLEAAAARDDNLFPLILDGVKIGASVGEICGRLARVFGRYRERR